MRHSTNPTTASLTYKGSQQHLSDVGPSTSHLGVSGGGNPELERKRKQKRLATNGWKEIADVILQRILTVQSWELEEKKAHFQSMAVYLKAI